MMRSRKFFALLIAVCFALGFVSSTQVAQAAPKQSVSTAVKTVDPLYGTISRSCNTRPSVWYTNDWATTTRTYLGGGRWQYYVNKSTNRTVLYNGGYPIDHTFLYLEAIYKSGVTNVIDTYFPTTQTSTYRYYNSGVDIRVYYKVFISGHTLKYFCTIYF